MKYRTMRLEWSGAGGTRRLVIESDESVGWYLYGFEDDRCVPDYLQDSLDDAKSQALEGFGADPAEWRVCDTPPPVNRPRRC
jgi:hypothetical protein